MGVELKVCGITELEDARYLAGAGVNYLGFIQHPESPRFAPPSLASDIIRWVHGPQPVGVFVNTPAAEVNAAAEEAGFDFVQLHGEEPRDLVAQVDRPVIKTIHVRPDATAAQLRTQFEQYADVVEYFLLDTHDATVWGGTGESFDWEIARELTAEYPVFLAGGIDAENVGRAVETMQPHALDLSSSLESAPGEKSFEKIDAFLQVYRKIAIDRAAPSN